MSSVVFASLRRRSVATVAHDSSRGLQWTSTRPLGWNDNKGLLRVRRCRTRQLSSSNSITRGGGGGGGAAASWLPLNPRSFGSGTNNGVWFWYLLATVPVVVWIRDNFVDIVCVKGTSMAPTLMPRDWVLVRKADAGTLFALVNSVQMLLWGNNDEDETNDPMDDNNEAAADSNRRKFLTRTQEALLRSKIQHYHEQQKQQELFRSGGREKSALPAWWYSRPPMVLPGQVVIFYSPEHYPKQLCVKRCMATGGFWLPPSSSSGSKWASRGLVPPFSFHIQGDYSPNSRDSRHWGPISENLLVGVAEYIVWPPSRWQRMAVAATPVLQGNNRISLWR